MVLSQIVGIIRYEFRMQWRARGLLVVMLALISLNVITALILSNSRETTPEATAQMNDRSVVVVWAPIAVTLIFLLPILTADTLPKDRQLHTADILHTTPLGFGTYITGKVLSVWVSAGSALVVVMVLAAVVWQVVMGGLNWPAYFEMWLVGVTSLVLINGGLGVLLPTWQPDRRRAVILNIAVFFVLPFALGITSVDTLWAYLNPVRYPVLGYYMLLPASTSGHLAATIAGGVLELVVVWLAVLGWYRWREVRR